MNDVKEPKQFNAFEEAAAIGKDVAAQEASLRRRLPASQQEPPTLDDKLACGFSRREIQQMKKAGMERPDMIPWADWNGPAQLNHRHMLVCHLAALGYMGRDIARATNFGEQRISALLKAPEIQYQIQLIREIEMQGLGVAQMIDKLAPQAIRVVEGILTNPGAKLSLKHKAATDILDRKLGKAQQRVEHSGSLIKEFYQTIKNIEGEKKRDVPLAITTQVIEAETVEVSKVAAQAPKEEKPLIETDKWFAENKL